MQCPKCGKETNTGFIKKWWKKENNECRGCVITIGDDGKWVQGCCKIDPKAEDFQIDEDVRKQFLKGRKENGLQGSEESG